jgi:hypothetical protein
MVLCVKDDRQGKQSVAMGRIGLGTARKRLIVGANFKSE